MPAQSGDPVSTALQVSLSGNSSKRDRDLSLLLSYSTKQILLSDIKCEEFTYDSTTFLKGLKSKYTVIGEKQIKDAPGKSTCDDKGKISVGNSCERTVNKKDSVKCNERTDSEPKLTSPSRTLWPPDAVNLEWKTSTPVGGGFVNLWNSCYLNSTLQALFHLPSFVNWLLTDNSHKCLSKSSTADCLICSVAQTVKNSQDSTGRAIKPCLIYSRLKSICKHFTPGTQEDAHEFLRHLVDSLDRTYLTPFKDLRLDHLSKETTPLGQIFGGYLRNEVCCQSCGHVSTTFQYFQDLPLDIANSSHIDGALDLFFSRECILEHEGYKCENCKRRVAFTKKFSLEKVPRVLCVQLKRFGAVSGKNNKTLAIAGKLNVNRFKAVKSKENLETYYLAAVVNHIGTSTSCGHYTAIAMAADRKYYVFDDQRVERLHDFSVNSSQAYILLYHLNPSASTVEPVTTTLHNGCGVKSTIQTSIAQESAKERIFGKGDSNVNSKNSKLFNSNILIKVTSSVSSSLSNVFGVKVTNGKAGCSSGDGNRTENSDNDVHLSSLKKAEVGSNKVQTKCSESLEKSEDVEQKELNSKNQGTDLPVSDPPKIVNGHKPNTKRSLVPYNESSCSSEEGSSKDDETTFRVVEPGVSPKKQRLDLPSRAAAEPDWIQSNGDTFVEKNGASPSSRLNGHSSPGKSRYINGKSNNIGQKWKVVSSSNRSPEKMDVSKHKSWKVKWSGEGRNDHKSHLMSTSHQGYGKQVPSWSGDNSELSKDVNRENFCNQRLLACDNYMPNKRKKFRDGHKSGYKGKKNRFNELQKRKINWFPFKGDCPDDQRRLNRYDKFRLDHPWSI